MKLFMIALAWAVVCLVCLQSSAYASDLQPNATVPKVVAHNKSVIVGLSAGAFFAVQYHVAWSSSLLGAGVVAGGPFYCAQDTLVGAEEVCLYLPSGINVNSLINAARACESGGVCDPLSNLQNQTVWLFSGSNDHVVPTGTVEAAVSVYRSFMPTNKIVSVINTIGSGHGWPTVSYGNPCGTESSPYINKCDYSASFEMLNSIIGNMKAGKSPVSTRYYSVRQQHYTPDNIDPASISMGPKAYLYIPEACEASPGLCHIVIAAHGCQQTVDTIGLEFIQYTELSDMGEGNNLIILYPQIIKVGSFCVGKNHTSNAFPLVDKAHPELVNPCGCFDWWGQMYTGMNYANQKGPQMITVKNMVDALVAGTLA